MITFPCCKINIGLDIVRKRPDGYHDISTVMYRVPWCDVLETVPARGVEATLQVSGHHVECPPEKNLVMKAYRSLEARVPVPPVDIYLHKVIPDGAGLGGGSADASFTLLALNELLGLELTKDMLAEIASEIGADCPFFVYGHAAMLATGTGTELKPVDLSLAGWHILLMKPPVSIPTREAYAGVTPKEPSAPLESLLTLPVDEWQGIIKNDFEESIMAKVPVVGEIKKAMLELGAVYSAMSGSGSAVYSLWRSDKMAETAEEEMRQRFGDARIFRGLLE